MFCLHLCLCTTCMQYLWIRRGNIRFPETRVTDGCYLPYRCWEPSLTGSNSALIPEHFLQSQVFLHYDKITESENFKGLYLGSWFRYFSPFCMWNVDRGETNHYRGKHMWKKAICFFVARKKEQERKYLWTRNISFKKPSSYPLLPTGHHLLVAYSAPNLSMD